MAERNAPVILLVDDEADLREMCRINIELGGMSVLEAGDGAEALALLDVNPDVSLVVLDAMMPVMDGWQLLAELSSRAPELPVIVVSASSGPAELDRAAAAGVLFIRKPFDPSELCRRIEETVAEHAVPGHRRPT